MLHLCGEGRNCLDLSKSKIKCPADCKLGKEKQLLGLLVVFNCVMSGVGGVGCSVVRVDCKILPSSHRSDHSAAKESMPEFPG